MSTDRDVTRIVRSWLEDGVTGLPDRVLDEVLDQLPATRQRRSWWSAWRNLLVTNPLKIAAAAAAVLAIAVVATSLYVGQSGDVGSRLGGPGAPEPSPSPTPAAELPISDGDLEPGTYAIESPFPVRITFDVPDGWSGLAGHSKAATVWKRALEVPDFGTMISFWIVDNVYTDPCGATLMSPPVGPTVDDLAAAIAAWPEADVSAPTDVTLDGYQGKSLEFTVPDALDACVDGDWHMWQSGGTIRATHFVQHDQLWILDVDGTRLVVEMVDSPEGTSDQARAELREIFDSIQITRP